MDSTGDGTMNFNQILEILFMKKWLIILPPFITSFLALVILLTVEPVYVSTQKIWSKELQEGSEILQVVRSNNIQDLYANVQRELILSDLVMKKVMEELNLTEPPVSNSHWSKLTHKLKVFKKELKPGSKKSIAQQKIEALKALRESVGVDIINPEIIVVSARMNSPEWAKRVVQSIVKNYKLEYLKILNDEIDEFEGVLQKRLSDLFLRVKKDEEALKNFESSHPDMVRKPQYMNPVGTYATSGGGPNVKAPLPSMSSEMSQVNSLTTIMHELAKLEMQKSELLTQVSLDSGKLRLVNLEIERNQILLNNDLNKLSQQARQAIEYQRLQWNVNLARERYTVLLMEFDQITLSRGTKLKQITSIAILDQAVEALYPIFPKKKIILIMAFTLGLLTGLCCVYIAYLLDETYYFTEDLESASGLKVISTISVSECLQDID